MKLQSQSSSRLEDVYIGQSTRSNLFRQSPIRQKVSYDQDLDYFSEVELKYKGDSQAPFSPKEQSLAFLTGRNNIQLEESQSVHILTIDSPLKLNSKVNSLKKKKKSNFFQEFSNPDKNLKNYSFQNDKNLLTQFKPTRSQSRQLHNSDAFFEKYKCWGQWFFIIYLVTQFVQNLKINSNNYYFRRISQKQFDMLNDLSSNYSYYNSSIYLLWKIYILILLIVNIFYIPVKITYGQFSNLQKNFWITLILEDIPAYSFLIEIIINFNCAVYKEGQIIEQRDKIFKIYAQGCFGQDLLVVGPYFLSMIFNTPYLDIIQLIRIKKIYKISNSVFFRINPTEFQQSVYDLCKLVYLILFVGHYCGCCFNLLAYVEKQVYNFNYTWLDMIQKETHNYQQNWLEDYISSLYFAVITMITVGYGDISPVNSYERIFVILVTLLSCGIFAYSVNSIGQLVGTMTQNKREFETKMSILSSHMNKKHISRDLQLKVKQYFLYLYRETIVDEEKGHQILQQLPDALQKKLKFETYSKLLPNKRLFSYNFSLKMIQDLTSYIKVVKYSPDQPILEKGQPQNNIGIYFIQKGRVQFFTNHGGKNGKNFMIADMEKGDMFNEEQFLTDDKISQTSAQAVNVVEVAFLPKEAFINVIKDYPEDYERYCKLREEVKTLQNYKFLMTKCIHCHLSIHSFQNCKMFSYSINQTHLAYQFKIANRFMQMRQFKNRKQYKTLHSYQLIEDCKLGVLKYLLNIINEQNQEEILEQINIISLQDEGDYYNNFQQNKKCAIEQIKQRLLEQQQYGEHFRIRKDSDYNYESSYSLMRNKKESDRIVKINIQKRDEEMSNFHKYQSNQSYNPMMIDGSEHSVDILCTELHNPHQMQQDSICDPLVTKLETINEDSMMLKQLGQPGRAKMIYSQLKDYASFADQANQENGVGNNFTKSIIRNRSSSSSKWAVGLGRLAQKLNGQRLNTEFRDTDSIHCHLQPNERQRKQYQNSPFLPNLDNYNRNDNFYNDLDMDRCYKWKQYFPHNNYDQVVKSNMDNSINIAQEKEKENEKQKIKEIQSILNSKKNSIALSNSSCRKRKKMSQNHGKNFINLHAVDNS